MVHEILQSVDFLGPLIIRVFVGTLFIVHGFPKLTKQGRVGTKGFLEQVKAPAPAFFAPFAGFAEFFGGLALLMGFLTSIVGVLLAIWMIATTWFAARKLGKKYVGGWELDLILLASSLAVAFVGPGTISLDNLLSNYVEWW